MRASVVLIGLLAAGCDVGPSHTTVDSFDRCHVGLHFAECRDGDSVDAAPVLGCDPGGYQCRWFTTGAVPREVEQVSRCPADDICCENNWPFESGNEDGIYPLFYALDRLPWDRQRFMAVTVGFDAALPIPAVASLDCTGSLASDRGPCAEVTRVSRRDLDTPAIVIAGAADFVGWTAVIEIDQADPATGALSARVCIHDFTDVVSASCPESTAQCATAGTLTLAAWPLAPGTALHLEATFADGATLIGDVGLTD